MTDEVSKSIDPDEIIIQEINANGQVYLGRDLEGKTVTIAYEVEE